MSNCYGWLRQYIRICQVATVRGEVVPAIVAPWDSNVYQLPGSLGRFRCACKLANQTRSSGPSTKTVKCAEPPQNKGAT